VTKGYDDVAGFLDALEPPKREVVALLRGIVIDAHPGLVEHIKWNAPSYVLYGEDRVTFNVRNKADQVQLVLHMGATRKEDRKAAPVLADDEGLVAWQSDIRGLMGFADRAVVEDQRAAITRLLARWLALGGP
jgi:uncharacterized protein YdhG (YjbR/CyaY superfamily)